MVAAQDAAPRATTAARGLPPTTMEETAPAPMAAPGTLQAPPTLLQAAPPAVAPASPLAVAPAWGWLFIRLSPRPGEARGSPPEPRRHPAPLLHADERRVAPGSPFPFPFPFPFPSCVRQNSCMEPRGGVFKNHCRCSHYLDFVVPPLNYLPLHR